MASPSSPFAVEPGSSDGDAGGGGPRRSSSLSSAPSFRPLVLGQGYSRTNIRWRRGRLLGRGQFGAVYLATDVDSGEVMAVKQMFMEREKQVQEIRQEVELMCRACFRNNNVVKCIGWSVGDELGSEAAVSGAAGAAGGASTDGFNRGLAASEGAAGTDSMAMVGNNFNIFMEYVPRGTIADHVKKHGPLNEILLRNYTRQVLLGLRSLHAAGIAHRDIKGLNLLLDEDNVVKVADFGSAKRIAKMNSSFSSMDQAALQALQGSPLWMAPEVIKQQVDQDVQAWKRADVWSVACTVIEMATGKPPWNNYSNPHTAM